MINLIPFKAVRPPREKVHLVASRSYVSYTPGALSRKLSENPYSFIHIINPEFSTGERTKKNSPERFKKVRKRYLDFIHHGFIESDSTSGFYLYSQSTPKGSFTGIIGGVSTLDYRSGKIKKHEQTLTKREEMFCDYLEICGFNAEPVLLSYREELSSLEALFATIKLERPEYEFTTTDKLTHRLWTVKNESDIERIKTVFQKIDCLYIADGHHRMASSSLLAEKRANQNRKHHGKEDYNFTMAMIIQGESLRISPFHRVITKDIEIHPDSFIDQLSLKFEIRKLDGPHYPSGKREFGLRLKGGWYSLKLRDFEGDGTAVSHLDAVILTKTILKPILNIKDQKRDKRIQFVPEGGDFDQIEKKIESGQCSALFTLCPVSSQELYDISDEGSTMPPKTTYIEPKLRSGLTIMNL
ncbi:MAG: DUF1015 domain-containing protein [Flavobacteriales bacterium]|nr:DUF1015 domain-containing protein [Flavobacteriales bacterium]